MDELHFDFGIRVWVLFSSLFVSPADIEAIINGHYVLFDADVALGKTTIFRKVYEKGFSKTNLCLEVSQYEPGYFFLSLVKSSVSSAPFGEWNFSINESLTEKVKCHAFWCDMKIFF